MDLLDLIARLEELPDGVFWCEEGIYKIHDGQVVELVEAE